MGTESFTHLHVHTEFSMLDGASRVEEAVKTAKADGQPALGITDHGNMYGVIDFYKACKKHGIKPVIGTEAYMAGEHRSERPVSRRKSEDDSGGETEDGKKVNYHITLLAENNTGYKNLIQLSSLAFLEGFYKKPRVDWELLERYHEGVIATTGCLGGHVLQHLLRDDYDGALEKAGRLQDIFGKDNLFIEIQDHGIPEQFKTNPQLVKLARALDAPLLATNDSHYTHADDALAHDALLCVQTGKRIDDTDRFKFSSDQHWLKTSAEMRSLFRELPDACDNTLWIAERANIEIEFGQTHLPKFPIPDGYQSDADYLRYLTYAGAAERWGTLTDSIKERLDFELDVISKMGFASYFLIVWDLIRFARERGIRVGPGRGSAAGCAVAYCLRITNLDPIEYDLLFERFLNPSRISMPDIDMDFDSRFRDEMIRYASQKYGQDHVAQIITFGRFKARAAVRDAARVLGQPFAVGDMIAKAMPKPIYGRDTPLDACFELTEGYEQGYAQAVDLRKLYDTNPDARQVIDVAKGLENLRRSDGIHAAAVVITPEPLTEYLPIQQKPAKEGVEAPIVTQYEMHAVEELGLLKMDFLGLRNLDVIDMTIEMIRKEQGVDVDIDNIPLDDGPTFDMLCRGDSVGVFQLESPGMRELIRRLAPTNLHDLGALVALYRPGPMAANMHNDYADRKNGRQEVKYFHEDAEEILCDTYGLMIYQEQMMRVAQKFAGYSLAEADNLRKACGKKIRELMAKERGKFIQSMTGQGYTQELANYVWDIIEPFADYSFNKSHAYGYAMIAYQTAYLKANYPVEYMTALLTSVKDGNRLPTYLAECRNIGIEIQVPDVNRSFSDFTPNVQDRAILFGLSAVKNIGESIALPLIEERKNGKFKDFYDFIERTNINKKVLDAMVKAGCFDQMGYTRRALAESCSQIVDVIRKAQKNREKGIVSLFESQDMLEYDRPEIPEVDEWDRDEKLNYEKEMLNIYISDHPLKGLDFSGLVNCTIADLDESSDNQFRRIGGVIASADIKKTKNGDMMAVFVVEDLTASIEVVAFPKTYEEFSWVIRPENVVVLNGRVDCKEDQPAKMVLQEIAPFDHGVETVVEPFHVRITHDVDLDALHNVLKAYPGKSLVVAHTPEGVVKLPVSVQVTTEFLRDIRKVL